MTCCCREGGEISAKNAQIGIIEEASIIKIDEDGDYREGDGDYSPNIR